MFVEVHLKCSFDSLTLDVLVLIVDVDFLRVAALVVKLSAHLTFALPILMARQVTALDVVAVFADASLPLLLRIRSAELLLLGVIDILPWRRSFSLPFEVPVLIILLVRAMGTLMEGAQIRVNIWLKARLEFHRVVLVLMIVATTSR